MVTCWIIWKSRNAEIFTDTKWELWHILNQISSLTDIIHRILATAVKPKITKEVRWIPPPENFYKVNVDGSSIGNPGKPGFGGSFRNVAGEWICGFSGFCGVTTCLNAELLAIYHALNLGWNKGFRLVICELIPSLPCSLFPRELNLIILTFPSSRASETLFLGLGTWLCSTPSMKETFVQIGLLNMELIWTNICSFGIPCLISFTILYLLMP